MIVRLACSPSAMTISDPVRFDPRVVGAPPSWRHMQIRAAAMVADAAVAELDRCEADQRDLSETEALHFHTDVAPHLGWVRLCDRNALPRVRSVGDHETTAASVDCSKLPRRQPARRVQHRHLAGECRAGVVRSGIRIDIDERARATVVEHCGSATADHSRADGLRTRTRDSNNGPELCLPPRLTRFQGSSRGAHELASCVHVPRGRRGGGVASRQRSTLTS